MNGCGKVTSICTASRGEKVKSCAPRPEYYLPYLRGKKWNEMKGYDSSREEKMPADTEAKKGYPGVYCVI